MKIRIKVPMEERTDISYWGMPLYERVYLRILYAVCAFVCVGSFFDVYAPASPIWFQCVAGGFAAFIALFYRILVPDGSYAIADWILDAMRLAAQDHVDKGQEGGEDELRQIQTAMAMREGYKKASLNVLMQNDDEHEEHDSAMIKGIKNDKDN